MNSTPDYVKLAADYDHGLLIFIVIMGVVGDFASICGFWRLGMRSIMDMIRPVFAKTPVLTT